MAYVQSSPTIIPFMAGARRAMHVEFTETGLTTTSEWSVACPFVSGEITLYRAALTSGSGSTIQPAVGTATGFTSAATDDDFADQIATAAATINDGTSLKFSGARGHLYGKTTPDSGTNNAAWTRLTIVEGHLS